MFEQYEESLGAPYQKPRSIDSVVRLKEDIRSAMKEAESAIEEVNKGNRKHQNKQIDPLSDKGKFYLQKLSVSYTLLKSCLKELNGIN